MLIVKYFDDYNCKKCEENWNTENYRNEMDLNIIKKIEQDHLCYALVFKQGKIINIKPKKFRPQ